MNIGAATAWRTTKGSGSGIAIIDTGVDYTHPEVQERFGVSKGYNFVDQNNNPMDDNEHGTHVAGIVAGRTRGVAPEATLYALKVLNEEGFGSMAYVLRAMDWVMEYNETHPAQINAVNLSLGSRSGNSVEERMCQLLRRSGVSVIAAAGNEEVDLDIYKREKNCCITSGQDTEYASCQIWNKRGFVFRRYPKNAGISV